jgi:hypothetical protein
MLPYIVSDLGDVRVVKGCINFVQNEERRGLIAAGSFEQKTLVLERVTHLWIAKRRASAATVFSPPESWSMSRNRFIGGIAW